MTISQQISPSSLRAYKLSKYVNGQPGKLLLEAKKARRVTSQFMSRKGAREAAKQAKSLKNSVKESGKLWDKLLSKIPGRNKEVKAAKAGGGLASLAVLAGLILVIAAKTITDIQIQNIGIDNELKNNSEFQKAFDRYQRNVLDIRALNKKIDAQNKTLQRNNKDLDNISKNFFSVKTQAEQAAKKGNDALYEVRQGRKILEDKIAEQSTNFQKLRVDFEKAIKGINSNFQIQIGKTIAEIQTSLKAANTQIKTTNDKIFSQSKLINELQSGVKSVQNTVINIPKTIDTKVEDLKQFTIKLINGKTQPVELEQKAIRQDLTQIKTNGITKQEIDGVNATLRKTYEQSFEYKAQQWQQEIQKQNDELNKKVSVTVSNSYSTTTSKIGEIEKQTTQLKTDLDKLNTRIGEQEKVNKDALPKLDSILTMLPLIPARAAGLINPNIPKPSDIERATGTAICRSLNGGCAGKSLDDAVNNVKKNNNDNTGSLLDKLNAGLQIPELALLGVINNKLGDQLPGGIAGKLVGGFKWLVLDRALNLMILATTIQNHLMLSNDIAQTLTGALNNIITLMGIKDDNNQPYDIGSLINSSIQNFVKSVVGDENYAVLSERWAKAVRVYQAAANVLNAFQNLTSTVLNALEVTAGRIGKIGNGLRKSGEVLENAYTWMNPQPKFNRVTKFLEGLQDASSTIQMVTQAPLDVINATTELTNANTEFVKALKEDGKTENQGTQDQEPEQLSIQLSTSKLASASKQIIETDLEADEDNN